MLITRSNSYKFSWHRAGTLAVGLFVLLTAVPLQAKETALDAAPMYQKKVRMDGLLREWPRLTELSEVVRGRSTPRALGTVAYDDTNLYVVMRVTDPTFYRSKKLSEQEDHGVLELAFPLRASNQRPQSYRTVTVRLFPGDPGKSAGAVKVAGKRVSSAKIIEAPTKGGFSFEASVPWSAIRSARSNRSGLRARLMYNDANQFGERRAVVATSKQAGSKLPRLTLEAEYALNNGFVRKKGYGTEPDYELLGNVVGDGMLERVAVYGHYLTVTGWNYRNGSQFYFQDLKLRNKADLKRFQLLDFTADGRQDLVLQRRVGTASQGKELLEVWNFRARNDGPQLIFQHEVAVAVAGAQVKNKVTLQQYKGKWRIVVSQGSHSGLEGEELDAEAFAAPRAGGISHAALVPWQRVTSRTYQWVTGASQFEVVDETLGKARVSRPKRGGKALWSGNQPPPGYGEPTAIDTQPFRAEDAVEPPSPPRAPTAQEKLERVYALYRADRGKRRKNPSFDFVTNVSGDKTPERVLVHDKDLVVFGKEFRAGTSYVFTNVGVKQAKHIRSVDARDVTGDGRAEVIVRGLIPVTANKKLGGGEVTRHALFIYKVTSSGVVRIFAAETGRSMKKNSVLGNIAFLPQERGFELELRPGRAIGWSQQDYPFPEDRFPYGGLEPLLLPWSE